jgi:hypothetical protein
MAIASRSEREKEAKAFIVRETTACCQIQRPQSFRELPSFLAIGKPLQPGAPLAEISENGWFMAAPARRLEPSAPLLPVGQGGRSLLDAHLA